jgi:hypothetical protein
MEKAVERMLPVEFVVRAGAAGAEQFGVFEIRRLGGKHVLARLHVVAAAAEHALLVAVVDDRLAADEEEQAVA